MLKQYAYILIKCNVGACHKEGTEAGASQQEGTSSGVPSASELQKGHGAQSSLSPKGNQTPGTQAAGAVALPLACLQPAPLGRELHRSQGAEEEGAGLRPALLTLCR